MIILAHSCTGKTKLAQRHQDILDHDDLNAVKRWGAKIDDLWDTLSFGKSGLMLPVLAGWHGCTAQKIQEMEQHSCHDILLCYPTTSCMNEYMERLLDRNFGDLVHKFSNKNIANDEMMQLMRNSFKSGFKEFDNAKFERVKRIRLRPGQFLEQALLENGVQLGD
ncbi:MAG: hypothetical protein LBG88_00890 [Christensenellaceae bacterium]|jgi:hypothetical protein|nr:hypothetical protein [Christensenellaceae bacterium]